MASFSVPNAFAFAHANQVCCLLLDRLLLKGRGILFRLLLKDLQRSVCSCCLFLFHAICLFLTFFCINAFLVALIYECKWSIQSDFVCVVIVTCFLSYSCYFFVWPPLICSVQCELYVLCWEECVVPSFDAPVLIVVLLCCAGSCDKLSGCNGHMQSIWPSWSFCDVYMQH